MAKKQSIELIASSIIKLIGHQVYIKYSDQSARVRQAVRNDKALEERAKELFNQWVNLKLSLVSVIEKKSPVEHTSDMDTPEGMFRGTNNHFFHNVNSLVTRELNFDEFYQEIRNDEIHRALKGIPQTIDPLEKSRVIIELAAGHRVEEIIDRLKQEYELE